MMAAIKNNQNGFALNVPDFLIPAYSITALPIEPAKSNAIEKGARKKLKSKASKNVAVENKTVGESKFITFTNETFTLWMAIIPIIITAIRKYDINANRKFAPKAGKNGKPMPN